MSHHYPIKWYDFAFREKMNISDKPKIKNKKLGRDDVTTTQWPACGLSPCESGMMTEWGVTASQLLAVERGKKKI